MHAEVTELEDGHWGLFVTSEIFEPGEMPKRLDRKIPVKERSAGEISVTSDRSYRNGEDRRILEELRSEGIVVDEMAKKALEPISVLILGAVAAASAGFFGKMGSDAWDGLKSRISALLARRRAENREFVFVIELRFVRLSGPQIVRIFTTSPEESALERLLASLPDELEEKLQALTESLPSDTGIVAFEYRSGELSPSYAVREDCVPLRVIARSSAADEAKNVEPQR